MCRGVASAVSKYGKGTTQKTVAFSMPVAQPRCIAVVAADADDAAVVGSVLIFYSSLT